MKSGDEFISISDLMSALMMVFLFISIAYMINVKSSQDDMKKIALMVKEYEIELNKALKKEFQDDLKRWNAVILEDNTFRFKSPDVLFQTGKSDIKERFKIILDDFFPRYVTVLRDKRFIDEIEEIRIEGHTSSRWESLINLDDIYIKNMQLSQDRAKNVLKYSFDIVEDEIVKLWLIEHLRANGLAFAKRILKQDGIEDMSASRRVEFRVFTKVKDKIGQILENAN